MALFIMLQTMQSEGQPLAGDPVRVPGHTTGSCPSDQERMDVANEFLRNVSTILNLTLCGGPGWRRVGFLDMTDPSQSCLSGLALKTYSPGLRSCGRATKILEKCRCSSLVLAAILLFS